MILKLLMIYLTYYKKKDKRQLGSKMEMIEDLIPSLTSDLFLT